MTLAVSAWGHDGLAYTGKDMRQLLGSQFDLPGIVTPAAFLVEQQTVAAATLKVAAGALAITADGAGLFGKYHVWNDASLNTASFDPTSGNGRKDRLICRVTNGVPALEIVKGTAAASPAEPSITGNNYEELALITMPATASTVLTAYITDRRRPAFRAGFGYGTVAMQARVAGMVAGMQFYQTDFNQISEYTTATTGWQKPWGMPWGRLMTGGSPTATTAIATGVGSTETVALTTSAVTLVANRRIRIRGLFQVRGSGSFRGAVRIRRGTTTGGTLLEGPLETNIPDILGGVGSFMLEVEDTSYTPGSVQWVFTGAGADLYNPSWYAIDDLGSSGAPA